MATGVPLPNKIQNAPQLWLGLELYFGAFFDLSSERDQSMGSGKIGWLKIDSYCTRLELSDDQRHDMHHHLRVMDDAYGDYVRKKNPT